MNKQVANPVAHPMVKLQRKVKSLIDSNVIKPEDSIGRIAFLLGNDWGYWKSELIDFEFSLQDPIKELLLVEDWDED